MTSGKDIGQELSFNVELEHPNPSGLSEGFNEYGVKETDDRVEFVYEAMQPGVRNGFRVTEDFLKRVAGNFSHEIPVMSFHEKRQFSFGNVTDLWFSDDALRLRGYVPKTGAQSHDEVVKRLTYDPPQIRNGSVGFGNQYTFSNDFDDEGNPVLEDAEALEFSLTHFPGGYDRESGGLKAQFEEAYQEYQSANAGDEDPQSGEVGFESADSRLVITTIEL